MKEVMSAAEFREFCRSMAKQQRRSQRRQRSSRTRSGAAEASQDRTQDAFTRLCRKELGLEVVKEYRFHETRKWRFDYAVPEKWVAIEVEGGAFTQGRHTRGRGFVADMEKYNTAGLMGWQVLRVIPAKLYTSGTLQMLAQAVGIEKN